MLGVLFMLAAVTSVSSVRPCGVCQCADDGTVMVCDGAGMTSPPSLSSAARDRLVGMGLQNNRLVELQLSYLLTCPQLKEVDVSDQMTAQGCVLLDFDPADYDYVIKGKFTLC